MRLEKFDERELGHEKIGRREKESCDLKNLKEGESDRALRLEKNRFGRERGGLGYWKNFRNGNET